MRSEAVSALEGYLDQALAVGRRLVGDAAFEAQRIVRVGGNTQANGKLLDHRLGSGPVVQKLHTQPVGGQDVEEDIFGALGIGEVAVVVYRHVVTGGDGARDDQRGGHWHVHRCDLVTHIDGVP